MVGRSSPVRPGATQWSGRTRPSWLHIFGSAVVAAMLMVGLPVVAAGATGEMPVSASWTTTTTGDGESINGVACPTAQECLAVGSSGNALAVQGGLIRRSADGGAKWTNVVFAGLSGTDLLDVGCATRSTCVAVGQEIAGAGGVIDVSTDGGRSWTQHDVPSAALLYGVSCASTAVCEVVGTSTRRTSLIVSTANGGRGWHLQRPPSGAADLDAVSCSSPRICVGVGDELARGKERGLIHCHDEWWPDVDGRPRSPTPSSSTVSRARR